MRISGLTADAARAELLAGQEEAVRRDAAMMIRRIEAEAQTTAKQRARAIVAEAIQRVASDQTAQTVVAVVHLPADEVKGRIIGREGRNIRAFETVTGVNVIIDDTPEAVLLSCFDPVRREIGRITLEMLIEDGRIHPHRIEEAYERARDEVDVLCQRAAEDALLEVGSPTCTRNWSRLIGRLQVPHSYGQNVLGHLVETAHIARGMASELGYRPDRRQPRGVPARHRQGAHPRGAGSARHHRRRARPQVRRDPTRSCTASRRTTTRCRPRPSRRCSPRPPTPAPAADRVRAGRSSSPTSSGWSRSRRSRVPSAGVEKVFAMQAGRELRVMVQPDVVDDLEAHVLAREVAKQIEEELTYPGQVRVTVVRESRATEIAR